MTCHDHVEGHMNASAYVIMPSDVQLHDAAKHDIVLDRSFCCINSKMLTLQGGLRESHWAAQEGMLQAQVPKVQCRLQIRADGLRKP